MAAASRSGPGQRGHLRVPHFPEKIQTSPVGLGFRVYILDQRKKKGPTPGSSIGFRVEGPISLTDPTSLNLKTLKVPPSPKLYQSSGANLGLVDGSIRPPKP